MFDVSEGVLNISHADSLPKSLDGGKGEVAEENMLTFGSLFAGIGGFDKGFEAAGMRCLWQVEIEADCRSVLARHFPGSERFKDVREAGRHNLKPVDIICGGFPCQDLSVAGKREGLKGERSGLFHEMVRITDELKPALLVWENVPGLLSSDDGRDFARVLVSLDAIGYGGAWTGLDAQWFGVAQRRRRVFGVFARRDIGAARCAEILSLGSRLRRDTPSRGEKGQGVAAPITRSFAKHGGAAGGKDSRPHNLVAPTLRSNGDAHSGFTDEHGLVSQWPADVAAPLNTGWASRSAGSQAQDWDSARGSQFVPAFAHTLKAEGHDASEDGTGRGVPLVACNNFGEREVATALSTSNERIDGDTETFIVSVDLQNTKLGGEVAGTIDTTRPARGGGQAVVAFDTTQITSDKNYSNPQPGAPCHPLAAGAHPPAVALSENQRHELNLTAYARQMTSGGGKPGQGYPAALTSTGVRRLTPVECERLQGFPDGWTEYGAEGERISDSARYRMLGNAVSEPCARWIGNRVVAVMS